MPNNIFQLTIECSETTAKVEIGSVGYNNQNFNSRTPAAVLQSIAIALSEFSGVISDNRPAGQRPIAEQIKEVTTRVGDLSETTKTTVKEYQKPEQKIWEAPADTRTAKYVGKDLYKEPPVIKPPKPQPEPKEEVGEDPWEGKLSTDQVADKINKPVYTVNDMRKAGKFPEPDGKIGKKNYWEEETVTGWIYDQSQEPEEPEEPEEQEEIEEEELPPEIEEEDSNNDYLKNL